MNASFQIILTPLIQTFKDVEDLKKDTEGRILENENRTNTLRDKLATMATKCQPDEPVRTVPMDPLLPLTASPSATPAILFGGADSILACAGVMVTEQRPWIHHVQVGMKHAT